MNPLTRTRRALPVLVAALAFGVSACGEDDVESTVNQGTDAAKSTGEDAKDAGKDAAGKAEDKAKDAKDDLEK